MIQTTEGEPYGSRPIKRARRTADDMAGIRKAIRELLEEDNPMTVRQVFYRLVSAGVIAKTEAEYKGTVTRLLTEMRRAREIPFSWLADNTRWMRIPRTSSSLADALKETQLFYRRDIWDEQDAYVEVWLEKDALSGVLYEETSEWHVPLMVTRGYPSVSYLHSAAEAIREQDRPAYLYYFGDYDPSGVDIPRAVEEGLREFSDGAEIYFERVAVNPEQIELYGLQTRPTKSSDTRAKTFKGESVEVDAIPPKALRQIVRNCIIQHIDADALERQRVVEAAEKQTLTGIIKSFRE